MLQSFISLMVHVCDVPNSNSRTTKELTVHYSTTHCLYSLTHYRILSVLMQASLCSLITCYYSHIQILIEFIPLHRCCSNLNRGPSYVINAKQFHFTGDHRRQLQHEKFLLHKKAHFQGLYPVNHARSNPEIVFTYTKLITQQIHSLHLRVYSCFQGLISRDFKTLSKPRLSYHH